MEFGLSFASHSTILVIVKFPSKTQPWNLAVTILNLYKSPRTNIETRLKLRLRRIDSPLVVTLVTTLTIAIVITTLIWSI